MNISLSNASNEANKQSISPNHPMRDSHEAEYYNSDGNGQPCVLEDEFFHFEKSFDDNVLETWKLHLGEKWNQIFWHKSRDGPVLSTNCRVCFKYHVKGFCFNDCNFKSAHMKLSGEDFSKADKYIKSLRNSGFRQGPGCDLPTIRIPLDKRLRHSNGVLGSRRFLNANDHGISFLHGKTKKLQKSQNYKRG